MTDVERVIWQHLRNRQLAGWKFRRQATIGPLIVDFLCVEARLIVEIDGGQHSQEQDASRSAFLERQGYTIVRFWNHEIGENLVGVLETIARAAASEKKDPHPTLSRRRERAKKASASHPKLAI